MSAYDLVKKKKDFSLISKGILQRLNISHKKLKLTSEKLIENRNKIKYKCVVTSRVCKLQHKYKEYKCNSCT